MKALVIKILDAGIFNDPRISKIKNKDKVFDATGIYPRYDNKSKRSVPYIKIPAGSLGVNHVANLLRVLWGERPIPTLRKISPMLEAEKDPYFEELARKCRVIITSVILPADKVHKVSYYPEETKTVRKSVGDSWQTATKPYFLDGKFVQIKGGLLYNDRLHRMIGNDLYHKFHETAKLFGEYDTVQQAIELMNKNKQDKRVKAFCDLCVEGGKKTLYNIIMNDNPGSNSINSTKSGRSVLNITMAIGAIQSIEKFSAMVYVPVSDEDLKRVDSGAGVASFLEGGYAAVDHVEDWSDLIDHQSTAVVEGELICG